MKEKDREIIISGYGSEELKEISIGLFELTDVLKIEEELWSDKVIAPSFLCTYHEMCFGIKEESKVATIYVMKEQIWDIV